MFPELLIGSGQSGAKPLWMTVFAEQAGIRIFLRGYGQEEFSEAEQKRIYWYDVLLYLTMMTEGAYREYEDDGQYQWAKPMFEASWKELVS